MPSDAHANASRPDALEAALSVLAALHDDARLVRDGIMAPAALTSSMQEAEDAIVWLRTEVAKRAGLDKLMQESLPHAEWQDKHIHPVGRETYQNWKVTVYLPVPLSEADKSPQAALARAVEVKALRPTAANARDDELAELRRQRDELRRALEIIAVGDAEDPKTQAAEELAAIGWWGSVPEASAPASSLTLRPEVAKRGGLDRSPPPRAWMHPDGRVVPASTMETARKDGGAMLTSLAGFSVPLYPPEAVAPASPSKPQPLTAERINDLAAEYGDEYDQTFSFNRQGRHSAVAFARAVEAQAVRFDVALMAQALEALRNVPEVGGLWDAQHADHHMQADMALSARLRQTSGELDSDTATDVAPAADPVARPSAR